MLATDAKPARPAKFDRSVQHRRSMIAKIHVARKQLPNMDEDDYRQILFDCTGHTSLTDCTDRDLAKVIDRLKTKGFRALPRKTAAAHPVALKARALWISLYHLNVVRNQAEEALEAFACERMKCERFNWANQREGYLLIEALKSMGTRNGWLMHDRATGRPLQTPVALQQSLCVAVLDKLIEAGIAPAGWDLATAMWRLCGIENGRADPWTAEDYQRAAAALGNKLRDHRAAFAKGKGK